jgi:hypothetical protein
MVRPLRPAGAHDAFRLDEQTLERLALDARDLGAHGGRDGRGIEMLDARFDDDRSAGARRRRAGKLNVLPECDLQVPLARRHGDAAGRVLQVEQILFAVEERDHPGELHGGPAIQPVRAQIVHGLGGPDDCRVRGRLPAADAAREACQEHRGQDVAGPAPTRNAPCGHMNGPHGSTGHLIIRLGRIAHGVSQLQTCGPSQEARPDVDPKGG